MRLVHRSFVALCALLALFLGGCAKQAVAPTATSAQPVTVPSPTTVAPTLTSELATATPELPVQIVQP